MRHKKLITTALCGVAAGLVLAFRVQAQQGMPAPSHETTTTSKSMNLEHDSVQSSAEHHYNSPAERANDDLIITEVKASLADKGISDRYPVAVDCDHGTVQLTGVVASADDAKQAASLSQNIKGVVAVQNRLTWR
jgi:osmotically-inducible protein OsmY